MKAALWTIVVILAVTGVIAASGRIFVLSDPARGERIARDLLDMAAKFRPPNAASVNQDATEMEARYRQHSTWVLAHVIPGLLFMILGPLQFVPGLRSRYPRL